MTDEGQADPGASPPPAVPAPVIAWGAPPMPATPPPPVEWAPAPPESPGISIGPVLRDTFARYAADPIRLFLVGLVPAILVLIVSTSTGPTVLVTILSVIATAITMALADGGPRSSLRAAIGLGVRRTGWVYAVAIVIGIVLMLIAVVPAFLISNLAGSNIGLVLVLGLLLAIPLLWVYSRLILALPAVVIDDVGANTALDRARDATKRVSTAAQVFVIVFIAGLASAPVSFAAGVLIGAEVIPPMVVYLVGGPLAAFVAPVGALAYVSMYRRAYPRYEEPELHPVAAAPTGPRSMWDVAEFEPAAGPSMATQRVIPALVPAPPYARLARALVGATLTLGIAGAVLSVWTIGTIAAGAIAGSADRVPPGTVAFGTSASLGTCSVFGRFTAMPADGRVAWIAAFSRPTKPTDTIRLVIKANGIEAVNETETPGAFDCIGTDTPESGLSSGLYDFTLTVNGTVSAHGTLVVRPYGSS